MKNILFALLLSVPAGAVEPETCAAWTLPAGGEHERLRALFDADWKHQMAESPEFATEVGYPGQNARWTDNSLEAIARRKRESACPARAAAAIDRAKLPAEDRLDYDLFKYQADLEAEGARFPSELLPISQMSGVQQELTQELMDSPSATPADQQDMLARLRGVAAVVDNVRVLLAVGLKRGVTQPKIALRDVPDQILTHAETDAAKNPLMKPFADLPAPVRAEAAKIIAEQAAPAYRRLHDYFVKEYLPKCRDDIAWSSLPDGAAWYAFRARHNTTTRLSPKEIHELGLSEVKRIRAEMDAVMKETGFKGDFEAFKTFLRTDPRFFYTDPQQLLVGYRDIAKRIDPELIKHFGRLPRLPYGVIPVPSYAEKSQTTAYYNGGSEKAGRPGYFYANLYAVDTRPKWEMEALTAHEAVPGHHLQISLAQEMADLPEFRKYGGYNAYTEGWGLYSESLGAELGLYKDPYSRFGELTYEMWRAVRLVVDTGMHSFGWSRRRAIDYFKENAGKTDHDIEVEVDRYIVWPGQALAYKIGQLKFLELKALARQELGARYDERAFHDEVLSLGSVPLDVLDAQTRAWIGRVKAQPSKR